MFSVMSVRRMVPTKGKTPGSVADPRRDPGKIEPKRQKHNVVKNCIQYSFHPPLPPNLFERRVLLAPPLFVRIKIVLLSRSCFHYTPGKRELHFVGPPTRRLTLFLIHRKSWITLAYLQRTKVNTFSLSSIPCNPPSSFYTIIIYTSLFFVHVLY